MDSATNQSGDEIQKLKAEMSRMKDDYERTLGVQTFANRNFRDFREFWPFSRKLMSLKSLNRAIRESLCSRKILRNFENL